MATDLATPLVGAAVHTSGTAPSVGKLNIYNATSGSITATLPQLSTLKVGARLCVQKYMGDTSSNTVTINAYSGDTFVYPSVTSIALYVPGEQREIQVVLISGTKKWAHVSSVTPTESLDSRHAPVSVMVPAVQTPKASVSASHVLFYSVLPYRLQVTPAVNDYIEWDVVLRSGTYNFNLSLLKTASCGIVTLTVNGGSSVGTIDNYAASNTFAVSDITGIVIPNTGLQKIRFTVASKNASSSNYYYSLLHWTMVRTGA